jgi:cytochrome c-type biogenesis protein CcmF
MLAVPLGPLLAWKRGDLIGVAQRLMLAFAGALIAAAAVLAVQNGGPVLAPFAVGLAAYVMIGALVDLAERLALFRVPATTAFARARGLPRSTYGTAVAHFSLGLVLLGIVGETQWNSERIVSLKPGATVSVSGYDVAFDGMVPRQGPNYRELAAKFTVRQGGVVLDVLEPSKRIFEARGTSTSEAALLTRGFSQIYVSLGDANPDGSIAVRLYHKPLVLLIWIGSLVMVLGGALSLSDRRLRVGAPKPARPKPARPDPAPQPAE